MMNGYCPREGYKVASPFSVLLRKSSLSYCPREGYKVASFEDILKFSTFNPGYCPREGYKVAS